MAARRWFLAAVPITTALGLSPAVARADAFTVWGFGPQAVGEAGARVARADDGTATAINPGGLGLGKGAHVEAGVMGAYSRLEAAGQRRSIDDPWGTTLALDLDVPLTGALAGRLRVGVGVYALPTRLLHLVVRGEKEPLFPYYDNRTQRLVVLPALSAKLFEGVSVGVSLNALAGLEGSADVRAGASRSPEPRIDQRAPTVMRPIVGARVDPASWLHLGLTYRAKFEVAFDVTTVADVGGVPLTVEVWQRQALFDPAQLSLGAAFDLSEQASVEIDGSYQGWGAYQGPLLGLRATLPGVYASSPEHALSFKDTFAVRAGGSYKLPLGSHQLTARAGAGYESSMLGAGRQGATDLVDSAKVFLGLGGQLSLAGVLPRSPLRVGLSLGAHLLPSKTQPSKALCQAAPCPPDTVAGPDGKDPAAGVDNPGYPRLTGGGAAGVVALSLGVDL